MNLQNDISFASIAKCVSRALRLELETYPKPGLVSRIDNGSHPDMDAQCFLDSIECLEPFFLSLAEAGAAGCSLHQLQEIGIAAEAAMLSATGGRNTHRGAIFSLGLLAAAAGRWSGGGISPGISLGKIVADCWGGEMVLPGELLCVSDGISMCHLHGISGARGEAKRGFPSVYEIGLPALGMSRVEFSDACVQAFFELLACCEDTTLLKRGGESGWKFARSEARRFLDAGGVLQQGWMDEAVAIHHVFVERNLTAGGVADLLSATMFVQQMEGPTLRDDMHCRQSLPRSLTGESGNRPGCGTSVHVQTS